MYLAGRFNDLISVGRTGQPVGDCGNADGKDYC